jgi:hypothetical protein
MREELVESGKAQVHHMLPQTGWVSYYLSGEEDAARALDLYKKNYDRLTACKSAGPLAGLSAVERRTFRKLLIRVRSNLDPGFEAE